jgi:hypothetical protein
MPVNYVTFRKQRCKALRPLHSKYRNKKYRNTSIEIKTRNSKFENRFLPTFSGW